MRRPVRITVTLPHSLLDEMEWDRRTRRETRSEYIRNAVADLALKHRQELVDSVERQYATGYSLRPETDAEVAETWAVSAPVLSAEPWE